MHGEEHDNDDDADEDVEKDVDDDYTHEWLSCSCYTPIEQPAKSSAR